MPKKFEDMDCDDLRQYCPVGETGGILSHGYNGPTMCEGRYCPQAYENYLEQFEEDELETETRACSECAQFKTTLDIPICKKKLMSVTADLHVTYHPDTGTCFEEAANGNMG